jgi:nicotinamidase-related amidase
MNECLLLVDLQNDYFPGGKMALAAVTDAAANAARLLKAFRERNLPLIHIQHISTRPGAGFFLPDTEGVRINDRVAPRQHETVLTKSFPNSFRDTNLLEILKELDAGNLLICGAMSHMCIDATTRAAFDLGFTCRVAEDACATKDLAFRGRTIAARQTFTPLLWWHCRSHALKSFERKKSLAPDAGQFLIEKVGIELRIFFFVKIEMNPNVQT